MTENFNPQDVEFSQTLRQAFTRINQNVQGVDTDVDNASLAISNLISDTTQEAVQDKVAGLFAHSNHTNLTATYNDAANRVELSASGGGGAPSAHASTHQPGGSDAMAVDAAVGTGSLRTLGTGAQQAAAGSALAAKLDVGTGTQNSTTFRRGDGTWAVPPTGSGSSTYYNVKDAPYNAAGNGSTDDHTAIMSAINAASAAGGGVVFFPRGHYILDSRPLYLKPRVILQGEGYHSLIENTGTNGTRTNDLWRNVVHPGTMHPAHLDNASATRYTLTNTVQGSPSVTTATAGHAANFSAGDLVVIRSTENTTIASAEVSHYWQFNEVRSVSGGVITLKHPVHEAWTAPFIQNITTATGTDHVTGQPLFLCAYGGMRDLRLRAPNSGVIQRGGMFESVVENVWMEGKGSVIINAICHSYWSNVHCISEDNRTFELKQGSHNSLFSGIRMQPRGANSLTTSMLDIGEGARDNRIENVAVLAQGWNRDVFRMAFARRNVIDGFDIFAQGAPVTTMLKFEHSAHGTTDNIYRNGRVFGNPNRYIHDVGAQARNVVKSCEFFGTAAVQNMLIEGDRNHVLNCEFQNAVSAVVQTGATNAVLKNNHNQGTLTNSGTGTIQGNNT